MTRLLFPHTDVGVALQVAVVVVVVGIGLWRNRSRPGPRLLVAGAGLVAFGLLALRAAH